MMRHRWHIALIAITMAVFTWYLITGRDLVETWVDFPLEITNPPNGMIIRGGMVSHVSARLRGPKGLIRSLETKKLAYSLDTGKLKVGSNAIDIAPTHLNLAGAIEIMEIRPSSLNLIVDMFVEKTVDVNVNWKGNLPSDYTLSGTSTLPAHVDLKGPASILNKIKSVDTRPIVFDSGFPDNFHGEIPLDLPSEVESNPAVVKVNVDYVVKKKKMWIKIPIDVLAPENVDFEASQNYVRLLVEAPKPFFRKSGFRNDIYASINLNATVMDGTNNFPIDITMPENCSIQEMRPEKMTITISRQKD